MTKRFCRVLLVTPLALVGVVGAPAAVVAWCSIEISVVIPDGSGAPDADAGRVAGRSR